MTQPEPLRPPREVVGAYIDVSLGGKSFELKELPRRANRQWLAGLQEAVGNLRTAEALETFDQMVGFLASQSEVMMDLLIAYDQLGNKVLPDREWIDTHATDGECYAAWKKVTAAASPLASELLQLVPQLVPVLIDALRRGVERGVAAGMMMTGSIQSLSSARANTAGMQSTSSPASPTPSSGSSTSRKRGSGSKAKPSPH